MTAEIEHALILFGNVGRQGICWETCGLREAGGRQKAAGTVKESLTLRSIASDFCRSKQRAATEHGDYTQHKPYSCNALLKVVLHRISAGSTALEAGIHGISRAKLSCSALTGFLASKPVGSITRSLFDPRLLS